MSSRAGAIRAGKAFVEMFVDDTAVQRGLARVGARFKSFGASITRIGATAFAFGSSGLAAFVPAIKAASDLQETMSKFDTVFGANATSMKAWGDNYAREVGRSKGEIAGFLAGTQDLLVPIGLDPAAAEETSKQLTRLAVDLASFNNMADADTLRDLHAALTGSGEVMKKYGVVVSETAVKQELLNRGLDPRSVTEAQKAMARLDIILRGTTAAQGDATRTAGSFANQWKRLKAEVTDAMAEIGTAVLPMVTEVVSHVSGAVAALGQWAKANPEVARTIFIAAGAVTGLGTVLLVLGGTVGAIGMAFSGMASVVGLAGTVLGAMLTPAGAVLAALGAFVAILGGVTIASLDWAAAMRTVEGSWPAIVAAVQAGDLEAATEIAFQAVRVSWKELIADMKDEWNGLTDSISDGLVGFGKGAMFGGILGNAIDDRTIQLQKNLDEVQAGEAVVRRREIEAERQKLKKMVDEAGKKFAHPSDLPLDGKELMKVVSSFDAAKIAPLVPAAEALAGSANRQRIGGTTSALSERIFVTEKKDEYGQKIAANTQQAVAILRQINAHPNPVYHY
ncbi:MAG: phage tail tape measure protein [Planctomycetaceae bacterium]|nr:phage tail tape measure protein [Planctomycetaceae bacterium]